MRTSELAALLSDTEYLAYRAGRAKSLASGWMYRARVHKRNGSHLAMHMCVEEAREANHEYLRNAIQLRNQKDLEAQRREDYRQTLRQY